MLLCCCLFILCWPLLTGTTVLFWPTKVHYRYKNGLFLTFMLINFLVWLLRFAKTLILSMKEWNFSKIENCRNFKYCLKRNSLPTYLVRIFGLSAVCKWLQGLVLLHTNSKFVVQNSISIWRASDCSFWFWKVMICRYDNLKKF